MTTILINKCGLFTLCECSVCSEVTCTSLVEQSRCLSHLFHDHLGNDGGRYPALMAVLQQINTIEEADSDVHEVSTLKHVMSAIFVELYILHVLSTS